MVSKNFLFAPLLCSVLLTGAAKIENGLRIHFRGDWPLGNGKFRICRLSMGRLGRTTGMLCGKRDWETKPSAHLTAAERQRAEMRDQSCHFPALSLFFERSTSCVSHPYPFCPSGISP